MPFEPHGTCGIPNHAFYLAATAIGGHAWEAAGRIWYAALRAATPTTEFQAFAETTSSKAAELYGASSTEQQVVADAWHQVGIPLATGPSHRVVETAPGGNGISAEVARDIDELTARLACLRQDLDLHLPA